jgi:PadR family transcriptional regulator PadR
MSTIYFLYKTWINKTFWFLRRIYFSYIWWINDFCSMKGAHLGEFEEIVLLTIASLMEEAYSVNIVDEIAKVTGRASKLGVVHAVLTRLQDKGMITSELGEPTKERGGRRKRFFEVSQAGKLALLNSKEQRDRLWSGIPDIVFDGLRWVINLIIRQNG